LWHDYDYVSIIQGWLNVFCVLKMPFVKKAVIVFMKSEVMTTAFATGASLRILEESTGARQRRFISWMPFWPLHSHFKNVNEAEMTFKVTRRKCG